MSQMLQEDPSLVEARSFYVRNRNVLLVRARFAPLYLDYYLHLMQHGLRNEPELDGRLKELLAAMVLHCCSRPQDETCAWTVHLEKPLANLFVTATNKPGRVTGRVFTDDIRAGGKNLFISQLTRPHHQPRQSMIEFTGDEMLRAVEQFYAQSEQRITRIFAFDDEEFIMLSAEPDCDEIWLNAITLEGVKELDTAEHLTPLETRGFHFECGCSIERLYPMIGKLPKDDLDHIFEDGVAVITCPRCAAVYRTPRDHFDKWIDNDSRPSA